MGSDSMWINPKRTIRTSSREQKRICHCEKDKHVGCSKGLCLSSDPWCPIARRFGPSGCCTSDNQELCRTRRQTCVAPTSNRLPKLPHECHQGRDSRRRHSRQY